MANEKTWGLKSDEDNLTGLKAVCSNVSAVLGLVVSFTTPPSAEELSLVKGYFLTLQYYDLT